MYWKFVCKKDTEAECFQRKLFGDTKGRWEEVKEVKEADTLFLYNLETDALFGPFTAETGGKENIESDAWKGAFSSQVRVGWGTLSIFTEASKVFPFLKVKRLRLGDDEGSKILSLLPEIKVSISSEIKIEIQKLDEEIHSLAHRIEETIMSRKRHPADREVELDRLKGEFYSKMRDFVWAVRRIDKTTKILDLTSNR